MKQFRQLFSETKASPACKTSEEGYDEAIAAYDKIFAILGDDLPTCNAFYVFLLKKYSQLVLDARQESAGKKKANDNTFDNLQNGKLLLSLLNLVDVKNSVCFQSNIQHSLICFYELFLQLITVIQFQLFCLYQFNGIIRLRHWVNQS